MWVNLWFANRESLCQSPSPQREKWGNCSHFGWQNVGTFRLSTGHKHTKCQHPGCSEPCADFSDFVSFLEYFWSSFVSQSYHNTFSDIFRYQYIYIFSQKSLVYFPRGWFNLQPLSFLPPPPPEKKKQMRNLPTCPPQKKPNAPFFSGRKRQATWTIHPSNAGEEALLQRLQTEPSVKPVNPASQRTGPQATVQVMAESPDAPETESFGTNLYESRGERLGYWDGWWIVESLSLYIMCCRWNGWVCWNVEHVKDSASKPNPARDRLKISNWNLGLSIVMLVYSVVWIKTEYVYNLLQYIYTVYQSTKLGQPPIVGILQLYSWKFHGEILEGSFVNLKKDRIQ